MLVATIMAIMLSKPSDSIITSKSELAYISIRNAIQTGTLNPGQRIGPRELAEDLGISYTPVREALTLLENEGLVNREPNKGTYVRSISRVQMDQIYSLRLFLEPMAASQAAENSSPQLISKLEGLLLAYKTAVDHNEITFKNQDFHYAIYAASLNQPLFGLIKQLWTGLPLQAISLRGGDQESQIEHTEIVTAIASGDAESAQSKMHTHINRGYRRLLQSLENSD